MASQFLSLEEAAQKLGVTTDRLVELRSQGRIRGFRDGASWKFPENELDRLADDLAGESGDYDPYKGMDDDLDELGSDAFATEVGSGSGVLVDELEVGSGLGSRGSKIIGGDGSKDDGSDVGIGSELLARSGSDVNLVAGDSDGSDVKIVSGGDSDDFMLKGGPSELVEIDSGELQLSPDEPVISHDSAVLDLAIEPNAGSTGPITDKELREIADQNPDVMVGKKPVTSDSGLNFDDDDEDSDEDMIGVSSDDDILDSDIEIQLRAPDSSGIGLSVSRGSNVSSLELMDDLDSMAGSSAGLASRSSRGVDVLSELDLLSADAGGSGLITGDSGQVLGSSDLGSGIGSAVGSGKGTGSGRKGRGSELDLDDALADDDDLVIADDEDDLVLGGSASDLSVSGDSGINLMSPSDSGLSLESEPLDLAGSSISALDLGAEIGSDIGSGSGKSNPAQKKVRSSAINFDADEDFRLSPSGVGVDGDAESNSQVIEVEDSSAFAEADVFGEADFGQADPMDEAEVVGDAFGEEAAIDDDAFAESATTSKSRARGSAVPTYEVPFSIFQVSMLMLTLAIMCLGGMLMTDLLRNMWAYTDTAAPVSSLTDALIELANLDG